MELNTYVEIIGLGIRGRIINIRVDTGLVPIITVELDNATNTPNGLYIAREFELRVI